MQMLRINNGDYIINLNLISDIDSSVEDCWTVTMNSGNCFDVENQDLVNLKAALGL